MELDTGAVSAEFGDKTSLIAQITTRSGLGKKGFFGSISGTYGTFGTGTGSAIQTLTAFFTNYTFIDNAIIGGTAGYPPINFFPSNNAAVGFVNFAGGDYTLTLGSPFRNAATDGKDVGADMAAIAAAISGAVSPILPAPKNLRVQ